MHHSRAFGATRERDEELREALLEAILNDPELDVRTMPTADE